MMIDFKGSSKKEFSKLLAGCHCVKVKLIPNLPSLQTVEKSKNFTIPLKGNALSIGYL